VAVGETQHIDDHAIVDRQCPLGESLSVGTFGCLGRDLSQTGKELTSRRRASSMCDAVWHRFPTSPAVVNTFHYDNY
jgi:hypothetical protein